MFLDACQSAGGLEGFKSTARFDTVGLINEFKSAGPGLITFASSLSRQLSAELGALQNGIFTKALLEGLAVPPTSMATKPSIPWNWTCI